MTSDLKDKGIIKSGVRVGYFPKGIFPRATSQVTISQVATYQMFNFPSGNFLKVTGERAPQLGWGRSRAPRLE